MSANEPGEKPSKVPPNQQQGQQLEQQQQQQQQQQYLQTRTQQRLETSFSGTSIDDAKTSKAGEASSADDHFMLLPPDNNQPLHIQSANYFAIDESLRRVLACEMHAANSVTESDLPFQVHNYYSLSPLETVEIYDVSGPVKQQAIKAQSISDGRHYTLSRIPNLQPNKKPELGAIDRWRQVQGPCLARVHEAFITHAFGDNSLVIVRDFKPLAASLGSRIAEGRVPEAEEFLWSIVLQLTSALNTVHAAGLAVQLLDVSTILISPANRVYIGCCGLADVLSLRAGHAMDVAQQGDLRSIGQILRILLSRNPDNMVSIRSQPPVAVPGPRFSPKFKELFGYLNHQLTPVVSVEDILRLAGSRVLAELDAARREADLVVDNLRLEMSNGRLVRILCKINYITERSDGIMDPEWSETGDRYLIKLFRDYVFHMVDNNGKPITDMAHVIGNLNKLDAGSHDKVMLMSRDEKSCLVVSYAEIKRCVEDAYQELRSSMRAWN
ncbi:PAB-dependent poly(A)-specific ribonuclease subunit 3 [Coemansia sp. RSA 988]|nr:PAB-dependent poly(A)-specific ribonuclease subunit 3 [Coemansia sp. RSA 988]